MKNTLIEDLIDLDISSPGSFEVFHPRTRDYESLNVLKCVKSGVIVLEEILRNNEYYVKAEKKGYTHLKEGFIKPPHLDDNLRRFESYKDFIKGSDILDFGCGMGGFLSLTQKISKSSIGMELNQEHVKKVNNIGLECFSDFDDLYSNYRFDLITLNHVFEHLTNPFEILSNLRKLLKDEGIIF